MKTKSEKGQNGLRFDDFLREQGCYEESSNQAVKRVIAHQLAAALAAQSQGQPLVIHSVDRLVSSSVQYWYTNGKRKVNSMSKGA